MTKFIENVNKYLSEMKIKQTFVSLKSGIEIKKLSRILTGVQDVSGTDMEKIADALGQEIEFFLSKNFFVPEMELPGASQFAFYAGTPNKEQEEFAMQLVELIENADEVLSAKGRFMMAGREYGHGD